MEDAKTINSKYNWQATLDTLQYIFKKSGIRGMDFIPDHIVNTEEPDKIKSSSLGAIIKPCEEHPNGGIVLYMDAILHYSNFIGKDFLHITAKVMFAQVHNLIMYNSGRKFNLQKAENFASKICKKLHKMDVFYWLPPVIYIDTKDPKMKYQILLKQEWLKNWTGKSIEELIELQNQ